MRILIGAVITIGALIKSAPVHHQPTPLDVIIEREAAINDIDAGLIRAIIKVESDWKSDAVSHKDARGLMQVMPEHLKYFGFKSVNDLHDDEKNIMAGTRLLREELDRFGNEVDALRAYNCGSPRITKGSKCGIVYAKKVLQTKEQVL
jgi:soluble lytic murein transglycosylase-like protein